MRRDISDYADSTNSLLASASGVPVLPILHLESREQVPTSLQKHGSNLLGPGSAKKSRERLPRGPGPCLVCQIKAGCSGPVGLDVDDSQSYEGFAYIVQNQPLLAADRETVWRWFSMAYLAHHELPKTHERNPFQKHTVAADCFCSIFSLSRPTRPAPHAPVRTPTRRTSCTSCCTPRPR